MSDLQTDPNLPINSSYTARSKDQEKRIYINIFIKIVLKKPVVAAWSTYASKSKGDNCIKFLAFLFTEAFCFFWFLFRLWKYYLTGSLLFCLMHHSNYCHIWTRFAKNFAKCRLKCWLLIQSRCLRRKTCFKPNQKTDVLWFTLLSDTKIQAIKIQSEIHFCTKRTPFQYKVRKMVEFWILIKQIV